MEQGTQSPLDLGAPAAGKGSKAWLVTFTDLVSLMLAFFVLLFSMSTIKTEKWEKMTDSLTQRLNPSDDSEPTAPSNIGGLLKLEGLNLDYLATLLETKVEPHPVLGNSLVYGLGDQLVVSLPGDLLFGSGQALLAQDAQKALFDLGGMLRNIANDIIVFGHTDPRPVTGDKFTSNWELSVARAVAVSNELRRAGYTRDIMAIGLADSRFEQISEDLPLLRRMELGRRVDIVLTPLAGG